MRGIGISVIFLKDSESINSTTNYEKSRILLYCCLWLWLPVNHTARIRTGSRCIPKSTESNSAKAVRVDILADDIIHVRAFPSKKADSLKSLVVDPSAVFPEVKWTLEDR